MDPQNTNGSSLIPAPQAQLAARETSSAAVAAQARAAVEARYVMALRNPRDVDRARAAILKSCARPGFAEKAIYAKPQAGARPDGKVRGPSIRLAEEMARAFGNIMCEVATVYDDDEMRIVRVTVTDLETNATWPKDVTVPKRVERKSPKDREILGERTNVDGEKVYIVRATDDETLIRENALASKAVRNGILRIIPSDVVEDALARAKETNSTPAKGVDLEARRKKIFDGFAEVGVAPDKVKWYVGHDMATISPEEWTELGELRNAIRDGETTWPEAVAARAEQRGETFKAPDAPAKSAAKGPAPRRDTRPANDAPPASAAAPATAPVEQRNTVVGNPDHASPTSARGTIEAPATPPPAAGPREPSPNSPEDLGYRPDPVTAPVGPDELEPRQIDLEIARLKLAKSYAEVQKILADMQAHRAAGRITPTDLAGVKDEIRALQARFPAKPEGQQ